MHFVSNGVRLYYTVEGQGPPVVLLHGALLDSETNWRAPGLLTALADRCRVVTVDSRGHGASDRPHDSQAYGPELVGDVVRLLDHLELDRSALVGYSMGADVALSLLTTHPDRVSVAVLGGSGWLQPESLSHFVYEWLARTMETVSATETVFDALRRPREFASSALREVLDANDPLAVRALCRRMVELAPTEAALRTNQIPLSAVVGELDREARPDVEALARVAPATRVTVLPGLDHKTTFQDPAFVRVVRNFLLAHL